MKYFVVLFLLITTVLFADSFGQAIPSKKEYSGPNVNRLKDVVLRLEVVDDYVIGEPKSVIFSDKPVLVRIFAIQKGEERIGFLTRDMQFEHYHPTITRDGVLLGYSEKYHELSKKIRDKNKHAIRGGGPSVKITPGREELLATLKLSDWYDRLEPGVYSIRIRFSLDLASLVSEPLAFEVKAADSKIK